MFKGKKGEERGEGRERPGVEGEKGLRVRTSKKKRARERHVISFNV